ncbi:MAG: tyrosine-protein phosphatase [Pseudomonadota bacterium]
MFAQFYDRLRQWDRKARRSFGRDLSTPRGRLAAHVHFNLFDHAWLRHLWTNFYEVAPGIYRSNQPGPGRIARYADMGIKTLVTLRGTSDQPHYQLEKRAAEAHGLTLLAVELGARHAAPRDEFLKLFDIFRDAERPILLHCKSGADRAGLVSVLYLLWSGHSVEEARSQLSFKYLHLKSTKTGILDHILDVYADAQAQTGIDIETWFKTCYEPHQMTRDWKGQKAAGDAQG